MFGAQRLCDSRFVALVFQDFAEQIMFYRVCRKSTDSTLKIESPSCCYSVIVEKKVRDELLDLARESGLHAPKVVSLDELAQLKDALPKRPRYLGKEDWKRSAQYMKEQNEKIKRLREKI